MTLLNWSIAPDGVFVMTDTACRMDGRCGIATSSTKVNPHPRLDLILAGTGCHSLVETWNNYVGVSALSEDIDGLDAEAQRALPRMWAHALDRGATGTSTVYHWGWSPLDKAYTGYAYRSAEGFRSERLAMGAYIKPEPFDLEAFRDPKTGDFIQGDTLEAYIAIAETQKRCDRASMAREPLAKSRVEDDGTVVGGVGIGGHLIGYWMSADDRGQAIVCRRIHTFGDHLNDQLNILALGMAGPDYALRHLDHDHRDQMVGRSHRRHRANRRLFQPSTWFWNPSALPTTPGETA